MGYRAGMEPISLWWYIGYALMGITVGLVFYVLHKETIPDMARRHLIMSIWLPVVFWVPIYLIIIFGTIAAGGNLR